MHSKINLVVVHSPGSVNGETNKVAWTAPHNTNLLFQPGFVCQLLPPRTFGLVSSLPRSVVVVMFAIVAAGALALGN